MFNLGFSEIVIIFVLLLVFFGAEKMPDIGRAIGRAAAEFKRGLGGVTGGEEQDSAYAESASPNTRALPAKRTKKASRKRTKKKVASKRKAKVAGKQRTRPTGKRAQRPKG
jgi:sec-independent protein translocase protein TatA